MLELHIGQAGEKVIVTLKEVQTLDEPYYLFRFMHVETKQVVSFIRSQVDEESDYPYRYNQFNVDTSTVFLAKPVGEWQYEVYEQASSSNTDPVLSTSLLESGKMILYPATDFEFTKYDEPVTFKTYNG